MTDKAQSQDSDAFNIGEAKRDLSRLVRRAEQGERIEIMRDNVPVAIIGPIPASRRRPGALLDLISEQEAGRLIAMLGEWSDDDEIAAEGRGKFQLARHVQTDPVADA